MQQLLFSFYFEALLPKENQPNHVSQPISTQLHSIVVQDQIWLKIMELRSLMNDTNIHNQT